MDVSQIPGHAICHGCSSEESERDRVEGGDSGLIVKLLLRRCIPILVAHLELSLKTILLKDTLAYRGRLSLQRVPARRPPLGWPAPLLPSRCCCPLGAAGDRAALGSHSFS